MINYEERLEELKCKRNVLSHTLPNDISKEEEEDAYSWWTNHECLKDEKKWGDEELGTLYPYITLMPTSIGTTIHVVCPICMKGKNVTDYGVW